MLSVVSLLLYITVVATEPLNWMRLSRYQRHQFERQVILPTGTTPDCANFIIGQQSYDHQVCLIVTGANVTLKYSARDQVTYRGAEV